MREDTFFLTVRELADRLATGAVTPSSSRSVPGPRGRPRRAPFDLPSEPRTDHDGKLATMVTIAHGHALEAAERADRELAAGQRRSILHGIPTG